MDDMWKVKTKQIILEYKLTYFKCMFYFITTAQGKPWVVRDVSSSSYITKGSLKFLAKAWWTFVPHRLSPNYVDNLLSPDRATIVMGILEGYRIYVSKL